MKYYVKAKMIIADHCWANTSLETVNHESINGPFDTKETAEQFAISMIRSGRFFNITIKEEQ